MSRHGTYQIIGQLNAEQKQLDDEIQKLLAQTKAQRLQQTKQNGSFIQQMLQGNYDQDYKQLVSQIQQIKLRLLNFCSISLDDNCLDAVKTLKRFRDDLQFKKENLQKELQQIEGKMVLEDLESIPYLNSKYKHIVRNHSLATQKILDLHNIYQVYIKQLEKVQKLRAQKSFEDDRKSEINQMILKLQQIQNQNNEQFK